jgi:hypothetical protein
MMITHKTELHILIEPELIYPSIKDLAERIRLLEFRRFVYQFVVVCRARLGLSLESEAGGRQ